MCKTTQRKISEACVHGSIFTITKRQMQPKCPLTCKRINKILHTHTHTHTGILCSLEKEGNPDIRYNMNEP